MTGQWVIWSEEHLAWWRPNSRGYTSNLRLAGRYSEEEAKSIEASANNNGHSFNEVAFQLPADFDAMLERKTQR